MRTILITGATGFVGSHILQAMQKHPVKTIAACRDKTKLPSWYHGEVRQGDLNDPSYLNSVLDGVDTVCHAAAWTSLWGHAQHCHELYYEPSMRLLDACIARKIARFLFVSTTSASASDNSADPLNPGIPRSFWPHLSNVIAIENAMRERASGSTTMVTLRCGLFVGEHYGLGLLPILLPRLKTHLVPWVAGGHTSMPLIDGSDIGSAFALAALNPDLKGYESFNIVGPEIPTVKQVIQFLHDEFGYPTPHFSVPFPAAYAFAWLMEKLDPIVPWQPLIVRSIVHLLEEVNVNNDKANSRLGYLPRVHWQDAIRKQIVEMKTNQTSNMKMFRPLPGAQIK